MGSVSYQCKRESKDLDSAWKDCCLLSLRVGRTGRFARMMMDSFKISLLKRSSRLKYARRIVYCGFVNVTCRFVALSRTTQVLSQYTGNREKADYVILVPQKKENVCRPPSWKREDEICKIY